MPAILTIVADELGEGQSHTPETGEAHEPILVLRNELGEGHSHTPEAGEAQEPIHELSNERENVSDEDEDDQLEKVHGLLQRWLYFAMERMRILSRPCVTFDSIPPLLQRLLPHYRLFEEMIGQAVASYLVQEAYVEHRVTIEVMKSFVALVELTLSINSRVVIASQSTDMAYTSKLPFWTSSLALEVSRCEEIQEVIGSIAWMESLAFLETDSESDSEEDGPPSLAPVTDSDIDEDLEE